MEKYIIKLHATNADEPHYILLVEDIKKYLGADSILVTYISDDRLLNDFEIIKL